MTDPRPGPDEGADLYMIDRIARAIESLDLYIERPEGGGRRQAVGPVEAAFLIWERAVEHGQQR